MQIKRIKIAMVNHNRWRRSGVILSALTAVTFAATGIGSSASYASSAHTARAASVSSHAASTRSTPLAVAAPTSHACQIANVTGSSFTYSASTDPSQMVTEAAAFNQLYPHIKVNYEEVSPTTEVTRLITEIQAGHTPDADLVAGTTPEFEPLIQGKDVVSMNTKSLGIPSSLVITVDGINLPRVHRKFLGLMYNTQKTSASQLPDSYQALINPKYAGKIMVDPRGINIGQLAVVMGERKYTAWLTQFLAVDKPVVVQSVSSQIVKVLAGEYLTGDGGDNSDIIQDSAAGQPIAIKYLSIIPVFDSYVVLLKNSNHKQAAECFTEWLDSRAGLAVVQRVEAKSNASVLPKGQAPKNAVYAAANNARQINLVNVATEQAAAAIAKM